jgi:hypothetical protein
MVGLAVLTLGIIVAAWPATSTKPPREAEQAQLGTASKGWYQEAEKQFR